MRGSRMVSVGMLVAVAGACAAQEHEHRETSVATSDSSAGDRTPLYDNLGSYHMAVATRAPLAQQYFDQGLRLTYGFNHDEAIKAFREGRARTRPARCAGGASPTRSGPTSTRRWIPRR